MKQLALSVNGNVIPLPKDVSSFTQRANFVPYILQHFIALLFFIVILLGLFYMIFSGFQWMTSGGDEEKAKKAQASITYTIVGMAVAFLAFLIINLIGNFFHTPITTPQ